MPVGVPGRAARRRSLLVVAVFLFWPGLAVAHELGERRDLIVSLSPEGVDVLVSYELPGGDVATRARHQIDLNRDGRIGLEGVEALAWAQLFVPRAAEGLLIELGDLSLPLVLSGIDLQDGAGAPEQRGFVVMLLYEWRGDVPASGALAVSRAAETAPATAMVQVVGDLIVVESVVPPAPDAPVFGPLELIPEAPITLSYRRPAASRSGEGTGSSAQDSAER